MTNNFIKFKIPTLLGLSIIIFGIIVGVFLTLQQQTIISKASPDVTAQNITLSNLTDTEATISWQTSTPATSFLTFGQTNPSEQTVLDDKDTQAPKPHLIHYVSLKNLLPKTTYQYKIVTGKISSAVSKFTTAAPLTSQVGFRPIIGSVLDGNNPLAEGVVYLSIADAQTLSASIKTAGNFLIPLSQIRKADLSDNFPLDSDTLIKLTVTAEKASASAIFKFKPDGNPLPALKLGQNVDLDSQAVPKFDLNKDGKINAADNAIILQNFGKKGKNIPGDVNGDGVVDQKDLDLMAKQINQ